MRLGLLRSRRTRIEALGAGAVPKGVQLVSRDIAVVTDSAAMLPRSLAASAGIIVAPLTIIVDGREYLDGVDIEADELYAALAEGPAVSTSQPSPGRIAECYQQAAEGGATAIISIHIGSGISGTVNSARAAAGISAIPVTIVDTGQASFAEGLCVLEAVDALDAGASITGAAERAEAAGAATGSSFVMKTLDLALRGGRLREGSDAAGVPVLALKPDGMKVVGNAATLEEAVALMGDQINDAAVLAGHRGQSLRVGIGNGAAPEIASALRARVEAMPHIGEIIDYDVGPSMGVHLGAGNAGAVFVARPVSIGPRDE